MLGIAKNDIPGYHPQTDGLVEKFNCTLINMGAKSAEKGDDWDKWLPYLFVCISGVGSREHQGVPVFLLYGRDRWIPTEHALTPPSLACMLDLDDYKTALITSLSQAWQLAKDNIEKAQVRQEMQYDCKSEETKFQVVDSVLVPPAFRDTRSTEEVQSPVPWTLHHYPSDRLQC